MTALPYVTAAGNIGKALKGIKAAATPERVSQDFVKTVLQIPGGSGDQMTSYLKKIGFAGPDGSPTEIYRSFRNNDSASRQAVAEAVRRGYAPLFQRNEFMHTLNDADLRALIVSETGQASDSSAVANIFACIKNLKEFADFSKPEPSARNEKVESNSPSTPALPVVNQLPQEKFGMNLSYTINLNLPATSDAAVFNAIFKSLKENLLKD
ncbi:MAG: DUF5343 domain-containing protein [Hyphomicrobiales bacterium]